MTQSYNKRTPYTIYILITKKDPFQSTLQLYAIFRRAVHLRILLYYLRRMKNNAQAPIIGAMAIDIKDIW